MEALATLKTESEGNEIELDKEVDARYVVQSLSPDFGSVLFCVRSLVEALVTLKTESQGKEVEVDKEVEIWHGVELGKEVEVDKEVERGQGGRARARR